MVALSKMAISPILQLYKAEITVFLNVRDQIADTDRTCIYSQGTVYIMSKRTAINMLNSHLTKAIKAPAFVVPVEEYAKLTCALNDTEVQSFQMPS